MTGILAEIKAAVLEGHCAVAAAQCRELLREDPGQVAAWTLLGAALCEAGQLDEAIAAFRQAVALRPLRAQAHANLALALERGAARDEALLEFREALRLQPDYAPAAAGCRRLDVPRAPEPVDPEPSGSVPAVLPVVGAARWRVLGALAGLVLVGLCAPRIRASLGSAEPTTVAPVAEGDSTRVGPPVAAETASVTVTVVLVGDVLLQGQPRPFGGVADALNRADVAFANLECPLTEHAKPTPWKFSGGELLPNEYLFRAPPRSAAALSKAGFDVVSLANNHAMDFGWEGLNGSIEALHQQGVAAVGAAPRRSDTWPAAVVERHGLRLGFLAYVAADTLPAGERFAATESRPGLALVDVDQAGGPSAATVTRLRDDLDRARRECDVLVVSMHWGVERSRAAVPGQRRLAHLLVDLGADAVIGHHPHVLQGVEVYQGAPIYYSLGNFVFPSNDDLTRRTGLAVLTVDATGVLRAELRPAYLTDGRPQLSTGLQADHTVALLGRLTTALGSTMASVPQEPGSAASWALDAGPAGPKEELVSLARAVPGVSLELRYASRRNAFGEAFYDSQEAYLRRGTAAKLVRAQAALVRRGLGLKVWDAYRPWSVQKRMWARVPDPRYVAPPETGSHHNRGAAVDVTLIDATGRELAMPTGYDDFSPRAWHESGGVGRRARFHRELLRQVMVDAGFRSLATEWWHYDDAEASRYAIANVRPERLRRSGPPGLRVPTPGSDNR